jgi:tRNA threonylcarbamoyl adenosine modification protein YeaZ
MRVLALDTALGSCSACVLESGSDRALAIEERRLERGHAEALMPLVASVMERVEGGFSSLSRVAVTVGPGSFTGLRVGLSAARAIGLAARIPVVGVSTLSAYCAGLMRREQGRAVAAAIDARHGMVYLQALGADGSMLASARQCEIAEAVSLLEGQPVSVTGSGADLLVKQAWAQGLDAVVVETGPGPDIVWVARLGLLAEPSAAPPRPLYLKAPDAHPQDNGKVARA